jgi:GDP-L-fucose synthase
VPRSREYDLVETAAVKRLYPDARPDIVIHLAARRWHRCQPANAGRFFYNAMMRTQLIEQGECTTRIFFARP